MTTWNPKSQPTPANIRKRITAAQDAINGAMDLIKKREPYNLKAVKNLDNAHGWLVSAQRRFLK